MFSDNMFNIGYQKFKKPDLEIMASQVPPSPLYKPFNLINYQPFNPIYTRFFSMTNINYNLIALNHKYQATDLWTVSDKDGNAIDAKIFVKFSPLLDPIKFMTGRYKLADPFTTALPGLDISAVSTKIGNVNNCSYTDCFFSYLSNMIGEYHGFRHSVPFYGSALAIQQTFRFNLEDDLDYVKESEFFLNSIGTHISLDKTTEYLLNTEIGNRDWSRAHRSKIQIGDVIDETVNLDEEIILDQDKDLEQDLKEDLEQDLKEDLEQGLEQDLKEDLKEDLQEDLKKDLEEDESSDNDSLSSKSDTTGTEDESEDEDEDEDEDSWETTSSSDQGNPNNSAYCYLHDFPVQLIFQEQCKGTFDDLILYDDLDDDEVLAALMQIVFILYTYNHCFKFTHNDLHTSNIMYTETDDPYLYYKAQGKYFKVPTYGRIYKLIDFGRAIYSYQGNVFCSDSFAFGGDAYSQYNCEPFFNDQKPRLEPNYSFDLCRLGCSLYDMIDQDDSMLFKLIEKWCTDDEGKNVLYKKTGQERYPDFKLYKMIARTVHNHTAKAQLSNEAFIQYECQHLPDIKFYDLDALPKYC